MNTITIESVVTSVIDFNKGQGKAVSQLFALFTQSVQAGTDWKKVDETFMSALADAVEASNKRAQIKLDVKSVNNSIKVYRSECNSFVKHTGEGFVYDGDMTYSLIRAWNKSVRDFKESMPKIMQEVMNPSVKADAVSESESDAETIEQVNPVNRLTALAAQIDAIIAGGALTHDEVITADRLASILNAAVQLDRKAA